MNFTGISKRFIDSSPLRESTKHSYSISFSIWSSFSKDKFPSPPLLLAFRKERLSQVQPGTVKKNLSALSTFLSWAEEEGIRLDFNKKILFKKLLRGLDSPKKNSFPPYLIEKLLTETERVDKRLILIYKLVIATGCRIGEILHLEPNDIDLENSILFIRPKSYWSSKSFSSIREIPLVSEELIIEIKKYLEKLDDKYLFPMKPGILWNRHFFTLQKKIFSHCGIDGGSHLLRHLVATEIIQHTGDVYLTSQILGHSKISTTQRYLDSASIMQKRDAFLRISKN